MKKLIIASHLLLATFGTFAQSEKYLTTMKATIAQIDSNFTNPSGMLDLANKFERIATAEKSQWLAYYYAALCQVNYAYGIMNKSKDGLDAIGDKAADLLFKADSLQPKNSENSCIKSMIATIHILVDPMNRFMQYGPEAEEALEEAKALDATNPRPHLLKGSSLMFTPENFGGGCSTAKPELQKAIDKYSTFKPMNDIAPTWGLQRAQGMIKGCK